MKRLLKNRFFAASLMFLLLDLVGGFVILAPMLIILRNRLDHSAEALNLWPVMGAMTLTDIFINDTQAVATAVISGIVIFVLYMLLRTFFSGGIYGIIILKDEQSISESTSTVPNPFEKFLARSASLWPGFIKVSLLSIPIYLLAIFIGMIASRIFSSLGFFIQSVVFLFFTLIASIYTQILKTAITSSGNSSIGESIRSTRSEIAHGAGRLIAGNVSVVVVGAFIAWILWLILGWIRGYHWSTGLAVLSIIFEQEIVFVICLMQVIRINFNYSIIKRGTQDVVGGNQLGGV